jgi:hypothetical protein
VLKVRKWCWSFEQWCWMFIQWYCRFVHWCWRFVQWCWRFLPWCWMLTQQFWKFLNAVVFSIQQCYIMWQFWTLNLPVYCGKYSSIRRSLLSLSSTSVVPGLFGTAWHRRILISTPLWESKIPHIVQDTRVNDVCRNNRCLLQESQKHTDTL